MDRSTVIAYRVGAHQLDRPRVDPADLAVLDIGVPDTPYGSAEVALAARTGRPADLAGLDLVWTVRGVPHLHRPADLPALSAALWPHSDADATARIRSGQIREGAKLGLAAFRAAAGAMREVVTGPMPKGEVSAAVSARVPESLTHDCRPCAARHISGGLFQQVGVHAGVRIDRSGRDTVLAPLATRPPVPDAPTGTDAFVTTYLRLFGPATPAEVAKYLDTTQGAVRPAWPDGLAEVTVDGRRAWLPADRLDALRCAPRPDLVRLLPPSDPYLQARDRDLIVPDRQRQKEVWRMIGNPGAVFVDGEVVGTWRARRGRSSLDVTLAPFEPLPARVLAAVEAEAALLAEVRGVTRADLTVTDP